MNVEAAPLPQKRTRPDRCGLIDGIPKKNKRKPWGEQDVITKHLREFHECRKCCAPCVRICSLFWRANLQRQQSSGDKCHSRSRQVSGTELLEDLLVEDITNGFLLYLLAVERALLGH